MTVHELIESLFAAGDWGRTDRILPIEAKIREAVIEEEAVGNIVIEQHEGYMSPDPMFTVVAKSKLQAGEYYLVHKPTNNVQEAI